MPRKRGQIYKISYDIYHKILKFIVGLTYDSDLQPAKLFPRTIASYVTNTISDNLMILQVNHNREKACVLCEMFCKLDVRRKLIITLAIIRLS